MAPFLTFGSAVTELASSFFSPSKCFSSRCTDSRVGQAGRRGAKETSSQWLCLQNKHSHCLPHRPRDKCRKASWYLAQVPKLNEHYICLRLTEQHGHKNKHQGSRVAVHAFHSSTREAEVGRALKLRPPLKPFRS